MTRRTNARIAGFTFLLYIAVAFPSMILMNRATSGASVAAKLATMAQHATDVRVAAILALLGCFSAVVLAVTLYAITREQDPDLAMLGLTCRVAEGITGAVTIPWTLGLLWLATAAGTNAVDVAAAQTVGAYVLELPPAFGATFFSVGSTAFAWLLLRGRMIPTWLAWLGVVGSLIIVVGLPLQFTQVVTGVPAQLMWLPVAVFELTLGPWLVIKGA